MRGPPPNRPGVRPAGGGGGAPARGGRARRRGTAKLKLGGGVAGHNGLKDIAAQLGTHGFWRLRIGIGHPGNKDLVADYVLTPPPAGERELIETALERSMEASGLLLDGDMEAAMLKLHTKS